MFGYVRAFKPYMRVFEYDIYKAVYCGLCKDMGRRYGFFTRFTLSYDFTFLALMDLSVHDKKLDAQMERCIAHPHKKSMCATCKNDMGRSSAAAVILTYHKLKDDIADRDIKSRLLAYSVIPFFKKPYKQAAKLYPELAPKIEDAMALQNKIEKEKCAGIDQACEPTAMMMKAVFGMIAVNDEQRDLLERFGYLLGRYIYITDALDDLYDDHKQGGYNPLLYKFSQNGKDCKSENIPQNMLDDIKAFADDSINFTLGELAEIYVKLDLKRYRDILDNIIYLGLKNTYSNVKKNAGHKHKNQSYERKHS